MTRGVRVAVVGATGVVGRGLLGCLEKRDFPFEEISLFASPGSEGKVLHVKGRPCRLAGLAAGAIGKFDMAFFAAPRGVSREFAPVFVRAGAAVVDTSADWGLEPGTPLVVPEVNAGGIGGHPGIVSSPSSAAVLLSLVLKPLHEAACIHRGIACALLPVSGEGRGSLEEFEDGLGKAATSPVSGQAHPLTSRFFGHSAGGSRVAEEIRKILGDSSILLDISCHRIPVTHGIYGSIQVETKAGFSTAAALARLRAFPGLRVVDRNGDFPPWDRVLQGDDVWAGPASEEGLRFQAACDNRLKGSALNAVQIAERILGI